MNAARAASERAQRHLSMWVRDFILYRARSHYIQGDRQRDRERISHLLDQRGILDSRVYECGFEGTVAAGSAFAPVAVVHDEAVLVIFPPSSRYLPVRIFHRAHLRKRLGDMNLY